ncbi:ArsR/SmtB family transcription factor [Amycolatopsis sp. NPDC003865]
MLRIHFTADDLARIQVHQEPHPLWEVLLSLHQLQTQEGNHVFEDWRRETKASLPASTAILTALARPKGYSPDFLTPPTTAYDLETTLDQLVETDARDLRADLTMLARETRLPRWAHSMARGDRKPLPLLADHIREYHSTALAPYWPAIRAHIHTSREHVAELLVSCGIEGVLRELFGDSTWRDNTLHVPYPADQDLRLQGRGLALIPSFFCWRRPITLASARAAPVLVYPVRHAPGWFSALSRGTSAPPSLEKLMGHTRATILSVLGGSCGLNTTELAGAVHTSLASASQHATALRDAGLITTVRLTSGAVHKVSQLGAKLLANSFVQIETRPGESGSPQEIHCVR